MYALLAPYSPHVPRPTRARSAAQMIVQRLLYFCVAAMASMSLWQAMSNTEVRRLMAHGTWDAPLRAASGPAGKGGDVEVGKV